MKTCRRCGRSFSGRYTAADPTICNACAHAGRMGANSRSSVELIDAMPDALPDVVDWLKKLDPDALDQVWVASAVHFAFEAGCDVKPLCSILNVVRERFRREDVVEDITVTERRRSIRAAVAKELPT